MSHENGPWRCTATKEKHANSKDLALRLQLRVASQHGLLGPFHARGTGTSAVHALKRGLKAQFSYRLLTAEIVSSFEKFMSEI